MAWYSLWFQHTFIVVLNYRINRFLYLLLGEAWSAIRTILAPLLFLLRPWGGGCDIHYKADIGPGFHILHPGFGVVISAKTRAGKNLLLVGGNCIGVTKSSEDYCDR